MNDVKVEWGNFWITCLTCDNRRHTGTWHNANLIKHAHQKNNKYHVCKIENRND